MNLQVRIDPPADGDMLITAAIGPAGEALTLWGPPDLKERVYARTVHPNGVSSAASQSAPWSARIVTTRPDGDSTVTGIGGLSLTYPHLQPLPGGRFLLAGTRCAFRDGEAEHNAAIIGPDGAVICTGTLGDGINDVQTTPSGRIIVGYFDEGIFGNFGWGGPAGPEPIGASGIVEFDSDLRPVWSYPGSSEEAPWIADCYALNVTGEDIWASVYPDFPIARIGDGQISVWANDLAAGAHVILVAEKTIGWLGGYHVNGEMMTVGELADAASTPRGAHRIINQAAVSLAKSPAVCGRDSKLHQITDSGEWYALDLATVRDVRG
jgi:hypothetical protein